MPPGAVFYWIRCVEGHDYLRWYLPGDGADPVASGRLTELVQDAFDRITAVGPTMTLSPGLDRYQLTGMPTFLAVERSVWDEPPVGTVSAGPVSVTAWLEPVEVRWDMGTGDAFACDGPGNTYSDLVPLRLQTIECPYVFTTHPIDHFGNETATGYEVSATVVYTANYRVEGIPGMGVVEASLGEVDGPTATGHQEVREMRAIMVPSE